MSFTINDSITLTSSASIDNIRISGNTVSSTDTDGHIILTPDGAGTVQTDNLQLDGNTISSTDTDGNIILAPNGAGTVQTDNLQLDGNTISSTNTDGHIIFSPNGIGNVGIGTSSPAEKLDVAGTLRHQGLTLNEGTAPNVDEIKTFELHLEPNTSTWINTGIQSTSLATGTYIVEVFSYSTASGNTGYLEFYDMRFSGIMSWISNTSGVSVDYNEILLHSTGRSNGGNVIYLRTASSGGILVLQMKTSTRNTSFNPANPSYNNFTFKFRRMI